MLGTVARGFRGIGWSSIFYSAFVAGWNRRRGRHAAGNRPVAGEHKKDWEQMEKRLLLAFVLSAAILLAWSVIFPPPQRQQMPAPGDVGPQAATPEAIAPTTDPPSDADEVVEEALPDTLSDQVVGGTVEETVKLSNENIAAVLTNRGAAVVSYHLLGYDSDSGGPLDLIQTVPLAETGPCS